MFVNLLSMDERAAALEKQLGWTSVLVQGKNCTLNASKAGMVNLVSGGSLETNQKAVRTPKKVHVLLDPVNEREKTFDTAIAQIARDNQIAIGFSLSSFLKSKGIQRVKLFKNAAYAVKICLKQKNPIVLVTGAETELGARAPEDLAAFATLLGLTKQQALWAVSKTPQAIIETAQRD